MNKTFITILKVYVGSGSFIFAIDGRRKKKREKSKNIGQLLDPHSQGRGRQVILDYDEKRHIVIRGQSFWETLKNGRERFLFNNH